MGGPGHATSRRAVLYPSQPRSAERPRSRAEQTPLRAGTGGGVGVPCWDIGGHGLLKPFRTRPISTPWQAAVSPRGTQRLGQMVEEEQIEQNH